MACRAGHVYSISKLEDLLAEDDRLTRSLTLGPEVIAIEIERGLEKPKPEAGSEDDS